MREDVACALRISPTAAAAKLHTATVLGTHFAATVHAMRSGAFGLDYARRRADGAHGLPPAAAAKVEAAVLPRAKNQTLTQFANSVRRAVLCADRRTTEQRHLNAVEQRRVVFTPRDDGVTEQFAVLPAAQAVVMRERVQRLADRWARVDARDGVIRTADQRRADALCALVLGTGDVASGPEVRPVVHVAVALSTLLHLDDQPADIAGHGPVPAILGRALALDPNGSWRRLLTDDTDRPLDYDRRTYRPPTHLAELVMTRDVHCTFPGCLRAARRCELDHLLAWDDGGNTSAAKLQCC